jgi:hypothetical protein
MNRVWRTIDEERRDVKRSLGTQFMENQVWQPIATGWFEKWKVYVNFDEDVPEPRDKEVRRNC